MSQKFTLPMSQKFNKPIKKFIGRKAAIEKLRVSPKEFEELCVLCSVFPVLGKEKKTVSPEIGWFYLLSDIKKIYYSDAYDVIRTNRENKKRRERYKEHNFEEKLKNCIDEEYGLVDLVKSKYSSFGDALADLGNTLKNLYLTDHLKIADVSDVLKAFEAFVKSRRLIDCAFFSKRGMYFSFKCENITVFWCIPYPSSETLGEVIEIKSDVIKHTKTSHIKLPDFSSESEESGEEVEIDPNDPSKLDVSLLSFSAPLNAMHLRLVLHKLTNLLQKDTSTSRPGLFSNQKYCVVLSNPDVKKWVEIVLESEGGSIVDLQAADIVIGEQISDVVEGKQYLYPQYVFDSLNSKYLLSTALYKIGRQLPLHKSPFSDIFSRLDSRTLKTLSNTKKYKIEDKIEDLY